MGVTELIGNTPLVKLDNFGLNKGVEVWAKLEGFNPSGSVKDRIAKFMIEGAEKEGLLKEGMTVVEASSGNTGIGLAMVGRLKRYRVLIVMPSSMSVERRKILASYGAEIVLTPAEDGMDGAIAVAEGIASREGYFMPNQFANKHNVLAHYETTGREIADKVTPTHFVAGVGTGGTIMGVGKRLREANPKLRIIGVEPHKDTPIQGLKNMKVSKKPDIFDNGFLDELIYVKLDDAMATARRLAKEESIFAGISSGAAMHGVLKVARKLEKATVVTIFPDSGDKYLSTGLYSGYAVSRRFKSLEPHR